MNNLLSISMSCAVPLYIMQIKQKGGVSEEDFQKAKECSTLLASKGDVLQYGGGKKGEVADVFNKTAFAIAVLSFCPGGIKIFGQHYMSEENLSFKRKKEFLKVKRKIKKGLEIERKSI